MKRCEYMTDETYNAKEAMNILKLPSTTFYRKVKEGAIPYKGRKPNMRFPKGAIHAIAELKAENKKVDPLTFKRATVAAIWARRDTTQQQDTNEDITPFKTILSWRERNKDICMQVSEGKEILGWTAFLPLEEKIILELTENKRKERDIPPEAIRKWSEEQISVYIFMLDVFPSSDEIRDIEVAAFLIRKTIRWALTLKERGDIKNWYAIAPNTAVQVLLEKLGFKYVNSLAGGKRKVYKLESVLRPSRLLKYFMGKR
jgi:hypothetical protein